MQKRIVDYENLKKVNQPFFEEFQRSVKRTIESGWYILGEEVKRFEREFAEYNGSKYCIGVASGLDALTLGLDVLELPEDSEVLVPSNTYIATVLAIIRAGLRPVLVEPERTTYNIDPERIRMQITQKTRAIMVVHLYGKLCDMSTIKAISSEYGLAIIEDCAQSHGSSWMNKKAGTFGEIGAFSFYPTKNLGALGDSGAILTDNDNLADKLLYFRNYGSKKRYYNDYLGYNSKLDELQAGLLTVKLKYLDRINKHKNTLATLYFRGLDASEFVLPAQDSAYYDTHHIFPIRHPRRDALREYLAENGVKTEVHYPVPPHKQTAYRRFFEGQQFPISEELHATILSLPISYATSEEDAHYVVEVLDRFEDRQDKQGRGRGSRGVDL